MSISGITSAATSYLSLTAVTPQSSDTGSAGSTSSSAPVSRDQFRSDLKSLVEAVKSGDMTAAQDALKVLQNDRPDMFSGTASAQGSKDASFQTDLKSLIDAITSGQATGAQDALTRLQSDVQAQAPRRHHGHHGHGTAAASAGTSATASDTTSATPAAATAGDQDGDGDSR